MKYQPQMTQEKRLVGTFLTMSAIIQVFYKPDHNLIDLEKIFWEYW